MTLQDKYARIRSILEEHNAAIGGSGKPGYIDPDKFIETIKAVGGTTEQRLRRFSYEDLLQCIPYENFGKLPQPVVIAKEIAAVFREGDADGEGKRISHRRVEMMTPAELVAAFDVTEPTSPVGKRLREISRGEPFIVFQSGRTIDVERTVMILGEIKQGFPSRTIINTPGYPVRQVFRVGELPDAFADENPLYPGRALRPDGTCDQTNRSWDGINVEIRQLVRLAVKSGECRTDIDTAHKILDISLQPNAMEMLTVRYPKAAVELNRLKSIGDLPKLRVSLNQGQRVESLSGGKKVIFG